MKNFESIKVNDKDELTHTITQTDIDKFVELTGDDNKIHVDENYTSRTKLKKPVAHGMLGASFISTVIGTKLPGDGALWFSQSLDFLLPVRAGDQIIIKVKVINKFERTRTIELLTEIFNQHKQKVITGIAKVKMIEQKQFVSEKENNKKKLVALVVGGTGGIGKAACLQLSKDGFDIAVHYHKNKGLAEEIKNQIIGQEKKAITVNCDINDYKSVKEMIRKTIRKLNTITVVVNCTTLSVHSIKFMDLDWESIQTHFSLNIRGSFNIIKCVIPVMEENGYGKIINFSTIAVDNPNPKWLHYITAKSALVGFTKSLAVELAPKGIRFNLISPGMTDTELVINIPEKTRLLTEARTPLRRIATPMDVAGAISFLASDKSDFVTGETLRVNGGLFML